VAVTAPDDRAGAVAAGLGDGGRLELGRHADFQSGRFERAVAVEVDRQRFQHRRQRAGDRRDLAAAVDRDRGVFVAWQRGRGEAAFGVDDELADLQTQRLGAAGSDEQRQSQRRRDQGLPCHRPPG
jgi:hypothetical protein